LSGSNTITGSVNFTGSLVDFLQVGTVTGSFSGDGSGLTGIAVTLPAGVVSSSLQFGTSDDVTFRNITASGDISSSGDIIATGTGSFNYVTTPIIEGSGSTALLHITGDVSASGDLSIAGFPSVSASLASGGGGGFTPSLSTDLPARNITSSANISASGILFVKQIDMHDPTAARINIYNQGSLITHLNAKGNVNSFIEASGSGANLGVGTNAPTEKFHVSGNVKVDGYITGSDFIQLAGTPGQHTGVKISASNSGGDIRDAQMIVPVHGFEIKNSSFNDVLKISYDKVGINTQYPVNFDYALRVSGSAGGTKAIEAIGDISSSGNIIAASFIGDGSSLTNLQRPTSLSVSANMTASNDNAGYFFEVGAVTCSIQSSSLVACDIGSEFEFFQSSSGNFLFETGSGVTLYSKSGNIKINGQYSGATLKKIRAEEWVLVGDLG